MLITAKFAGLCRTCGERIAEGAAMEWAPGAAYHPACLPKANKSACEVCGVCPSDHANGGRKNRQRIPASWWQAWPSGYAEKFAAAGFAAEHYAGKLACYSCRSPLFRAINA